MTTEISQTGGTLKVTYGMDGRVAQNTTALVDEVIPKNISESNKLTEVLQNGIIKKITTATGGNGANIYTDIAVNHVGKLYYHNVYLGSANYLTDEKGNIRAVTTSDEWGNVREGSNNDINIAGLDRTFGYTSYTYDKVLDLSFAQRRFYDGGDRRFISQDPVKDGINWYRYCEGNPVRFVDPWGEDAGIYVIGTGNFKYVDQDKDINASVKDSNFEFDEVQGVLAEYKNKRIVGFWKMVAKVQNNMEAGKGDMIFYRMKLNTSTVAEEFKPFTPGDKDYNKQFYSANGKHKAEFAYDNGNLVAYHTDNEGINLNILDFIYYRQGGGNGVNGPRLISSGRWQYGIHYRERYISNRDDTLPKTKSAAMQAKYVRVNRIGVKYHGGAEGNLKYIHKDGREAIYRNLNIGKNVTWNPYYNDDGMAEVESDSYAGGLDEDYELVKLNGNEGIGPTFNYAFSTDLGAAYTQHYYLDMLPYYKWGTKVIK